MVTISNECESPMDYALFCAKLLLVSQPFDAGHDYGHHQEVNNIARDIANHIGGEITEPIDVDALDIATMWHDVVVTIPASTGEKDKQKIKLDTCKKLETFLRKLDFEDVFIINVILAVQFHSYEDEPQNIIGKILFDADKLSTISIDRWVKILQAYKEGKINETDYQMYINDGKKRILEMLGKLHFDYSKELCRQRMKAILEDKRAIEIALEIGLDLVALFGDA